ncbi:MAG: hypothetical protein V1777_05690 [Candidatus Micrarchaeota archaeon]
MKLQQQWKARQKRRKLLVLSPTERKKVNYSQKKMEEIPWGQDEVRPDTRSLKEVNAEHNVDFMVRLRELKQRFRNQTLEVLDEAAGKSTFATQLTEEANREFGPNAIRITRTDIREKGLSGLKIDRVPVERLVEKYGKNRFHLVVSTLGGPNYTSITSIKALANIIEVLKPGGEARVKTQFTDPSVIRNLKKRYPKIFLFTPDNCRIMIFK